MGNNKEQSKKQQAEYTFPTPIQDLIIGYLNNDIAPIENIYSANNVSTLFEGGTKQKPYDKLALSVLLGHVVRGEQDQAEAILRVNPQLLFKTGTIKDLAGNVFVDYSAASLACYAMDVEMLNMMKAYLNEKDEALFYQIIAQAIEDIRKHQTYDFNPLVYMITEGNIEQRAGAIAEFRKQFAHREIRLEKSYHIEDMLLAYEIYINNYYPWDASQCSLFWCEVIGYFQRSVPACVAQAFCQGFMNLAENDQPLSRALVLTTGESFYPVSEKLGLGFDFATYSGKASSRDACVREGIPNPLGYDRIEKSYPAMRKYFDHKLQELNELLKSHDKCNALKVRCS